jgi:Flp pilus assembly pilin Flp
MRRGLQLWLRFKDLADDERAQDMVEYALLGGFVALAGSVS